MAFTNLKTRTTLLSVALLAAGCADTTRPEAVFKGTLNVVVADDGAGAPGSFSGRLSADFRVSISRDGSDWVHLGVPTQVDLELQAAGGALNLHPPIDVPAGTYPYLRIVGGWGLARIEGGAEVGGRSFPDPVHLRVGEERLAIETRLATAIFVAPGGHMTLRIDLNSEAWVSPENLEAGRVPQADVETALTDRAHERLPALVAPPLNRQA
ncbi:hypothetical protein [Candidatus Palauibacter sp.]|uniref:hypothetical protein n=1 Tax=Candidatus Palauibacter sp. TaxID=3101350 RepID=UPI003CC5C6BC